MQTITAAEFFGHPVNIIDHAGKRWLTAEEAGRCLGYNEANARQGVNNLYKRHEDEFTEADTTVIKLMTVTGEKDSRIFSASGCTLLGFFASTAQAKRFRTWAKEVLEAPLALSPTPPPPAGEGLYPAVTRSPRLEGAMQQMAQSMATLADGMQTVIAQTNMTKRYISLLEMNQTGRQAITPRIREEIFRLSAEGMNNADIARLLRVSRNSVSLIVRGRYMETAVPDAPLPAATAHRLLEDAIERERAALEMEGGAA